MIALLIFNARTGFGQRDCVLKKESDSIKVYTCASDQSKFKAVRATFTVTTTLSQLAGFLFDAANYTEWQYNTVQSTILKRVSEREIVFYSKIEAPWPVSNRDMIVNLSITQDPVSKNVTLTARSLPSLMPENKNMVRVPMSEAVWHIHPLSATKVSVDYFIQIDPGGSVPAWMVNMVSTQAPLDSFKKLKVRIAEHQSKNVRLPFIKDL